MEEIGDVRTIVRDLFHREVSGKQGAKRRRILMVPPGGKSGVQSAGALHALEDIGIPANHFDIIGGLSAGSYNGTAYSAGKSHKLRQVYEHLCDVPFLFPQWSTGGWTKWGWWYGDFMNLQYLHDLLTDLGLDDEPRHEWPDLRIGISDSDGRLSLPSVRHTDSVLRLCRASSSVAPLTSGVCIDGKRYYDGGHAHPCPIKEMVRDIYGRGEEVDVLVIANRPHPRHQTYLEQLAFQYMALWLPWYSWKLYDSTRQFDTKMARTAAMAERRRDWIRIGMLFPSPHDAILQFEGRKWEVQRAGHTAYWKMTQLAAECKAARQI